ncbi:type II toxin-antitoxin system prevent-host-death family antitoxin [Gallionella capsiferriformans]|uniref:Antitoxin n=1 Tax=Gallionella capsiferriformans (strain ES-2) TaxID=395494 RepID=D9SCM6_GALCS|nr:type II toxin-antitoxin system prevent-host-death family antitoxin [Gallionella capsiferriformans]ADL56607.1 prevent-host-death family protein [Gallionella capsiferriformans ES-2]
MREQIISLTDFKTSASRLLQETRGGANIILTQNGSASAVVQDYATYRTQQDAFLMLKLMVQGEANVSKCQLTSQSEVFSSMRASLLEQQNG